MFRRLLALTLLMTALLCSASARTAPEEASPFSGTWRVLYTIDNGLAQAASGASGGACYVFHAKGVTFPDAPDALCPLHIQEDAATATDGSGNVTRFTPVGQDLMTASSGRVTRILVRVVSQEAPDNPFLGDWQVILVHSGSGAPVAADAYLDMRFGQYSVSTLLNGRPIAARKCTYDGRQCLITNGESQAICTIDESGMMTMRHLDTGVICFLLPRSAPQPTQ